MSHYKDFLEELPERSLKLLKNYYELEKTKIDSYEVTLLISIAMPLFVITKELIEKNPNNELKVTKFYNSLNGSRKILSGISRKWLYSSIDKTDKPLLEIEQLINETPIIESNNKDLSILSQIRNALSHGGIKFTQENNEIAKILFFSEKRNKKNELEGYHLNLIPVDDFKLLLENWCNLLKTEGIKTWYNLFANAA